MRDWFMSKTVASGSLRNSPKQPTARVLFCHGAGAPMDSQFMDTMAELLSGHGFDVVRIEFPYMAERRLTGKRRPPNPMPQLLDFLQQQVSAWSAYDQLPLFVVGKSMGGRVAAMLTRQEVCAVVALGYPLHPIGKPEKLRLEPLLTRQCPLLIVQGERDLLGNRAEFEALALPERVLLHWLPDGDHDLKPRVKSGFTHLEHLQRAAQLIAAFTTDYVTHQS